MKICYFHVVFTIPSELNPLVSMNQRIMYDLLFRSVSETIEKLANDPKHLGGLSAFSIPGVRTSWIILTSTVLSPGVGYLLMEANGCHAAKAFSFT